MISWPLSKELAIAETSESRLPSLVPVMDEEPTLTTILLALGMSL
jgi:hypothetical protein